MSIVKWLVRGIQAACLVVLCATGQADLSVTQEQSVMEVTNHHKRIGTAWSFADGYAITAAHVVEGEHTLNVTYVGITYRCHVLAKYDQYDIALLRVRNLDVVTPLKVANTVTQGTPVIIYGFPSGAGYSRSAGYVTGTGSQLQYKNLYRFAGTTNAKVHGGYSGGPVVDRKTNKVVGVLTNQEPSGWMMFGMVVDTNGVFTRCNDFYGLTGYEMLR